MDTTESTENREKSGRDHLLDEPSILSALRTIFHAGILVAAAIALVTIPLGWRMAPLLCSFAAVSLAAGRVLDHFGWRRAGILVGLTGSGYAALQAAVFDGGLQSVALVLIPVLLIVGSLVLERLMVILFTAGAIVAIACVVLVEYLALHRRQLDTGDLGDFVVIAMICAIAALVGRIIARRIHEGIQLTRASERRYSRIFENIQDVYFEMSPRGTVSELSPSGAALLHREREQIIGRSLSEFFCDETEFARFLAETAQNGRVTNRELGMCDSNGARVEVLVNATVRHTAGEPGESIIGSIRDITKRRRAEEARRETEEHLQLALDASAAGTFVVHPRGKAILSDIARKHFGIKADAEITAQALLEAVYLDDREMIRRTYHDTALAGGDGKLALEFRASDVNQGARWLSVRARLFFDGENEPMRVIGTVQDVTERKNLEEQLRRRVEELQTVMDVAPVALFTAQDRECSVITGNTAAYRMLEAPEGSNLSIADKTGVAQLWRMRANGETVHTSELPLQAAAGGLEVRDCELEILLSSGAKRVLWGHASQLRDVSGKSRGAIGAFLDITEMRQRAEDILRESESRFQNTADACPVIIWLGDREKRLIFVNKQAARFTGLPAEHLLGDRWMELIHPDDLGYARDIYFDAVDRRAEYQLEYRMRRADGEYRDMLGTTRPRYFGREYAGQIGSVIDITDVKRRHEETHARQKMESIGLLASGIAHDFNNLLGSVLAYSEIALATVEAGERPDEQLKAIGSTAAHGAGIVRQLMAYAGQEENNSEPADVSRTIEDMLELLRISVPNNGTLKVDLPAGLPATGADASQIRQIVLNLVTNACEALGGREGEILVSARRSVAASVASGSTAEPTTQRAYVELSVSDTGCGISAGDHAKLFDPFFTTKGPGRGLGLAVVQGIVRSLNGFIRVESGAGTGTTVRVALPCAPDPIGENLSTSAKPEPKKSEHVSVLVVEDEHLLREAVVQILRKRGFSVTAASDGGAALEAIREQNGSLDAVLLDITLPGESSRDVLTAAMNLRPQPKVIVTSAYGREYAAEYLQTDPEHFIRKPFRATQLTEVLIEAVGRAPARNN